MAVLSDAGLKRSCFAISDAPTRSVILYECFAAKNGAAAASFGDSEEAANLVCQPTLAVAKFGQRVSLAALWHSRVLTEALLATPVVLRYAYDR